MTEKIRTFKWLQNNLKTGYIAMNKDRKWYWFSRKPVLNDKLDCWLSSNNSTVELYKIFKIKPLKNWKESLYECGKTDL